MDDVKGQDIMMTSHDHMLLSEVPLEDDVRSLKLGYFVCISKRHCDLLILICLGSTARVACHADRVYRLYGCGYI